MKLWQLKKLSTNENLNEPQPLPENWGPIFGLQGFIDKLNDLSWVGLPDQGWFEVGEKVLKHEEQKKIVDEQIKSYLNESSEKVSVDNVEITKGERADWMEYRKLLKEIPNQVNYPYEIIWPSKPE